MKGIFLAVCNLPELQFIECGLMQSKAIEKYINKFGTAKNLALKSFLSHPDLDLNKIYSLLPNNLTHVCLSQTKQDSESQLLGFQNFFEHFGTNLTSVILTRFSIPIDLSIVGKFCPNVTYLNLYVVNGSTNCTYEFTDTFKLVEHFVLAGLDTDCIPLPLLVQILSSKHLTTLDLSCYGEIQDSMENLLDMARENEGMLSNLREFKLPDYHDTYHLPRLIDLVSLAPRLKEINVDKILHRHKDISKLHDFICEAGAKTAVIRSK